VLQQSGNLFWNNTNVRLGIGTSSPLVSNHIVYNDNTFLNGILVQNTNLGNQSYTGIGLQDAAGTIRAGFQYIPSTFGFAGLQNTTIFASVTQSRLAFIANSGAIGSTPQDIFFSTLGSNTTYQMQIKGNGNVQIGTNTDAGFKLDVNGTARVQGNATISLNQNAETGLTIINNTSGTLARAQLALSTNAGSSTIGKYSTATTAYKIVAASDLYMYNPTSGDISFLNDVATGRIKFAAGASSTAQMTLFATGNVGINTTTDAGFRLDVNGTARVQGDLTISKAGATGVILNDSSNGNVPFFAMQQGGTTKVLFEAGVGLAGRLDIGVSGSRVFTLGAGGVFGVTIGRTYVGSTPPTDGLSVQGSALFGTTTNITSSKLTIESTTQGFLPPRMTTTQRNAIASPAAGLIVYDTTLNLPHVFNGPIWVSLYNKNMKTQPTQGVAIEPIVYPLNAGTATQISVLVLNFTTEATTCTTYWQLLTEDGKVVADDNYDLTPEQFAAWGTDNNVVNEYVAQAIGVTLK
jgi:hypothetical protein